MEILLQIFTPPRILDLALLLLLLIVAATYGRRGFLGGLIHFIGSLASIIGSAWASQQAAAWIFQKFLYAGYKQQMQQLVDGGIMPGVEELIGQYGGFLPAAFQDEIAEKATELIANNASDLAEQLVTQVLQPLTTPMISMILFFIFFALCRMVLGLIVNILSAANKIPVLGDVNRILGFALGILAGMLDVFLILCILFAVMTITAGTLPYLNPTELGGSIGLRIFGYVNPFYS